MNFYYQMVTWLIETHFSGREKDKLRDYLGKPQPKPEPMTDVQILRNNFRQGILSRKKRKS